MSERSRSSASGRLRQLLFGSATPASSADESLLLLDRRLLAIERGLEAFTEAAQSSTRAPSTPPTEDLPLVRPQDDALERSVAALEKQINRAGREQLKLNVLVETQIEQQRVALEALQVANERRDDEVSALREQLRAAQHTARLDMIRALLPVLDGLDEAARSGAALLVEAPVPRRGLFVRRPQDTPTVEQKLRESMSAWLEGLRFVRRRLLDVLAAEGVIPMEADGQVFDPHRHTVLDVVAVADRSPGTVVSTLRQGYIAGDYVVRHAEVAVAGETSEHHRLRGGDNERER